MEPLTDPCNDRIVSAVQAPPHRPLRHDLLFPKGKKVPNWRLLRDHLQKEGRLTKEDLLLLIRRVTTVFENEPNVLKIDDPVTVVGDIHGQFFDLLKILQVGGPPESTKYLFLGDYVDRGSFSLEVVTLMFAIKLNFPSTIVMLRGNHECRHMTSFFNFRQECLYKYDEEVYTAVMDCFDALPIGCIINEKFLGVHGGISPDLKTVKDLNDLFRFNEPPRLGLFCDVLWADPVDNDDGKLEAAFKSNDSRGCSFFYGVKAVNKFLDQNNLLSVIRAHEAQLEGYKMYKWNGSGDFPLVITVFSAPNYCDVYNNKGAIIKFENNTLNIQQFTYTEHPYILPNFLDIFSWSIPFVSEKIVEIMQSIVKPEGMKDKEDKKIEKIDKGSEEAKRNLAERQVQIKNKIKAMSRMMKMFKTRREENEALIQLKGMAPDNRIPKGLLLGGKDAIKNALREFKRVKKADALNERYPEAK
eukprot:CAMPEP_0115012316 /NCGR_PEP_ID=MMETSP0216-20121206/24649_1 /TAXON_ID=223996 /ORGANISM="Protocruzia adherens, Strain Boccale" /LENGTH=470 /DNA_ID=CAMNT_0002381319 /DNA_START=932 /DNA_END=2344 /DNA_ORIENTATION=+